MLNWGNSIPCHFSKTNKWCNEVMHHELRKGSGRTCIFQRVNNSPPPPHPHHWREPKFCRDKTRLLSQQKYACRDNIMFVYFCRDETCHDKYLSRKTRLSLRQNYASIIFVPTELCKYNVCRDKSFVATNTPYLTPPHLTPPHLNPPSRSSVWRKKQHLRTDTNGLINGNLKGGGGGGRGVGGGRKNWVGRKTTGLIQKC